MAGGGTKRQKVEPPSAMDEDDASDSDEEFMAPTVYARSPFRRGEEVLVPANAFGDDYAAENPETLSGTLICIKSVERDEAGGAVAVVSLRKAVPQVWSKLFAADAEPAEAPALLTDCSLAQRCRRELALRPSPAVSRDALPTQSPGPSASHIRRS